MGIENSNLMTSSRGLRISQDLWELFGETLLYSPMVTRHSAYLISAMFSALLSPTPEIILRNPETSRQCHELSQDWIRMVGIRNLDFMISSRNLRMLMGVIW